MRTMLLVTTAQLLEANGRIGELGAKLSPDNGERLDPKGLHSIAQYDPYSPTGDATPTHGRCCVNAVVSADSATVPMWADFLLADLDRFASFDGSTLVGAGGSITFAPVRAGAGVEVASPTPAGAGTTGGESQADPNAGGGSE